MNKELTPTHSRYEIDDNKIKCSRNADGTGNSFYKELYEPLLELLIDGDKDYLNNLKNCSFNNNLFTNYFQKLKMDPIYNPTCQHCTLKNTDSAIICSACREPLRIVNVNINIFEDLFTYFGTLSYYTNNLSDLEKIRPKEFLKKYLIFDTSNEDLSVVKSEIKITTTSGESIEYELIGSIYSLNNRGVHFWVYIHNKNIIQSERIDDLENKPINEDVKGVSTYLLYMQKGLAYKDSYPLTQQINNLASISNEINTIGKNRLNELNYKIISELIKNKLKQKVCKVCTLINKSIDTKCEACGADLN